MSVAQVLALAGIAVVLNQWKQGRSLTLLGVSTLVIYWIQPVQTPVNLTFWFPTFTLILTVIFWLITAEAEARTWRQNWAAMAVMLGVVILVDLNRYFQFEFLFITDTPRISLTAAVLLSFTAFAFLLARAKKFPAFLLVLGIVGLMGGLVLLKTPSALTRLIETVAALRGKEAGVASAFSWLGFSYIAFRLMHTLFDRRSGRLPSVSLGDYLNYVIFFPAIAAGPIDRLERFTRNLNEPVVLTQEAWLEAGTRLFLGLFKKFIIADGLAWLALSDTLAQHVHTPAWLWLFLYAYSLQIYFDFSGYTDIAIGLGKLLGIQLPENFDAPYLKPNLTQFWNAWHMTLTQWFRAYFFNPLTRWMRSAKISLPMWLMILVAQLATMTLIGLWHGVTLGFLLWGLWHGLGLFVQNRWSDWMRNRIPAWGVTPRGAVVLRSLGIFLTFHYVTVGWLFFFLPDPRTAWSVMLRLVGVV